MGRRKNKNRMGNNNNNNNPAAQGVCWFCKKSGHLPADCLFNSQSSNAALCTACSGRGHFEKGCPNAATNFQGNYNQGNQNQGNHNQGNQNPGNQNQGNYNQGNQRLGNQNRGNQGNQYQGNQNRGNQGNYNQGNQHQGHQHQGNQHQGNQNHGNQNHGNQNHNNQHQGNGNQDNDNQSMVCDYCGRVNDLRKVRNKGSTDERTGIFMQGNDQEAAGNRQFNPQAQPFGTTQAPPFFVPSKQPTGPFPTNEDKGWHGNPALAPQQQVSRAGFYDNPHPGSTCRIQVDEDGEVVMSDICSCPNCPQPPQQNNWTMEQRATC